MTRADYLIRIPATKRLRQDPTGALVGGPALALEESLANKALIDTFHSGLRSHEVVFGEKGGPHPSNTPTHQMMNGSGASASAKRSAVSVVADSVRERKLQPLAQYAMLHAGGFESKEQ